MRAWKRLTDPTENIMGPAIVWYEHPIIQGAVGIGIGGMVGDIIGNSVSSVDIGAGIGMVGIPILYWKGRDLNDYISTNPLCQQVIQSLQRIF